MTSGNRIGFMRCYIGFASQIIIMPAKSLDKHFRIHIKEQPVDGLEYQALIVQVDDFHEGESRRMVFPFLGSERIFIFSQQAFAVAKE